MKGKHTNRWGNTGYSDDNMPHLSSHDVSNFNSAQDVPTPDQYNDINRRRPTMDFSGERQLAFAILCDACFCVSHIDHPSNARLRSDGRFAKEWFEDNDRTQVHSFVSICDLFDLDADALRKAALSGKLRKADDYTKSKRANNQFTFSHFTAKKAA